ncbi:MAG: hypothetical protein WBL63_14505 [Candidatus Acidiferrum sp.]
MRYSPRLPLALCAFGFLAASLAAQGGSGAVDIAARITPTAARPEPVRQFALYVLTKSYADIIKEVESQDALPALEKFIDSQACSPELKTWLKAHQVIDLTSPDLDQVLTTDDIMNVPEFLAAYQRSNAGGVTTGLPKPKYRESDKEPNPERYKKQREEFLSATRKFIETHPGTVQGLELQLTGVNPKPAWDGLHADHKRRVAQLAPDTAQVKYLAGKAETDLDGRALITGLPAGNYWVSSLGMDAASGDRRLLWDVPVSVRAGQTTHLELSNLNATDARRTTAP